MSKERKDIIKNKNIASCKLPSNTAVAKSSSIKSSIKKIHPVANLIRGLSVVEAMLQLTFSNKKVSSDLLQVLRAAIANAENNFGYDLDKLYVSAVHMGKAFTLKRMRFGARGRGRPIKKRYSNVSIYVSEKNIVAI